ncbi:MAG TPA: hypothetical protein VGF75_00380 [Candidatus Saccharimonadales bacterium]|jgi:hypothetical protein
MTTTAVTTDQSQAAVSVKADNVVYRRYVKGTPNAKDANKTDWEVKIVSAPTDKTDEEMDKLGFKRQAEQSVIVQRAGTVDGFAQIIPDEDERVNIFNRGLSQKLSQKLTAKLTETNDDGSPEFVFAEEVYNPSDLLNEETKRRNLSPSERAVKMLRMSGLSEAQISAMISAMGDAAQ